MRQRATVGKRNAFTMVEVVLALAVIAIALMSIISLIPIGANAARAAISEGFAADISEHLLHYLAEELTKDANADGVYNDNWATLPATLPEHDQMPNIGELNTVLTDPDYNPSGTTDILKLVQDPLPLAAPWNAAPVVSLTPSTKLYTATVSGFPVYRVVQQTTQEGGHISTVNHIDEIDAVVRVWKSPTKAHEWTGAWTERTDLTYSRRVQLNIEMSWPGTSDFRFRQRAYYTLEVSLR